MPHSSLDAVDARFIDLTGHDLLHVQEVVLQMPDMAIFPLATSDYHSRFDHYIDLTIALPQPHNTFAMTMDGFLLVQENAEPLLFVGVLLLCPRCTTG